jgi:hypothetical protein
MRQKRKREERFTYVNDKKFRMHRFAKKNKGKVKKES